MQRPISASLPADLPENWQTGQIVSPTGTEVGLSEQYGYNYQSAQINAAQQGVNALNEAFDNIAPLVSPSFTGTPTAPTAATDYTTYRLRNMALMSSAPSGAIGNGQLVGVYE